MEDSNFEFLIEKYPRCYVYCKKMDFFIYLEFFEEAAVNARKAVEGMVKYMDRHYNPSTYADYAITRGKYFGHHVNDLYNDNYLSYNIKEDVFNIWENCGSSAHPDKETVYNQATTTYYAKLTHKILKYIFNYIESRETDSRYNSITGEEDWIKENEADSKVVKALENDIRKKEDELKEYKEKYKQLDEDYAADKDKYQNEIKRLEESIENLQNAGIDEEILEATLAPIKSQMKQKEEEFKIKEEERISKMKSLKLKYESREKELSDELESLRNKLENSIFDIEDLNISDTSKSVLKIRYPPIELPKKTGLTMQLVQDNSQYGAIYSESKRLVIDAGPGSGKTYVIIRRIEHLIHKYDPDSFLVITFSEKAANELKTRLKKKLDSEIVDKIHVSTIHSFCRTFLRDNSSLEINVLDDDKKKMFIKHIFAEKFSGASYIPPSEFRAVFEDFDDCSTFDCDYDAWIESIKQKYFKEKDLKADREQYYPLLESEGLGDDDFVFPENYVRSSRLYNERWYAHKYLAIAEATKEYQELLKKKSLYDFDRLQIAARDFLKENNDNLKINYKNILIDEFQDTDVVQKEIFELLLENANTFTIVGDKDQSIYRWRGSNNEYLEEFASKDGFDKVILNKNYRSGSNIVEFNEKYIGREDDEKKLSSGRDKDKGDAAVYYLENVTPSEQADKIVEIIKYLHDKKNVKYSDIGLLFRSTLQNKINELVHRFEEEGIGYTVKGSQDLDSEKYSEVRAILYLLWYCTDSMRYCDLSDFSFAVTPIHEFSDETVKILVSQSENPKELSFMNRKDLENLGISGNDHEFLLELNDLKRIFHYGPEAEDKLTILGLYNKLFKITNFVDYEFGIKDSLGFNDKNNYKLLNLSLISRIIENYMDTVDKFDLDGVFKYLIESYGFYTSPYNDKDKEDAVHLLTIHKAKGLEFPVVFLCTLQEYTFPLTYFKKKWEKNYNGEFIKYPVFNKYLNHKTSSNEAGSHYAEEKRVFYVGTTRAEDLLIISSVYHKGKTVSKELKKIKRKGVEELELDYLKDLKINHTPSHKSFKKPVLSYSSFNDFTDCRHKYDLLHNYGFKVDSSEAIDVGIIVHDILNKIHTKSKNEGHVEDGFIDEIIENVYGSNPFIKDEYSNIIESIKEYWMLFGSEWKILDSELPFSIVGEKYDFQGKIDLIVQEDPNINEITIIDFKTTNDERLNRPGVREKYMHQLQLYYHALKKDPRYSDYEITKLKIFQIDGEDISDDENNNFEIDEDDIQVLLNSLDYSVDQMYDGIYDKNLKSCYLCPLKDLCNLDKVIF